MTLSKGIRTNHWMLGDKNIARRQEIREKIRLSKIGKHASPETDIKNNLNCCINKIMEVLDSNGKSSCNQSAIR